jgi:hypothetical protein
MEDKKQKLWNIVENFIKKEKIYCPEAITQSDNVIVNAYDFIEECCNVVGYIDCNTGEIKNDNN